MHVVKIPKRNYGKRKIPRSYTEDTLLFDKATRLNSTGNLLFELKAIAMQTVEAIQEWQAEQKQLLAAGETNQALESLRVAGSQPSVSGDVNYVTMPKHDKVREKPGNFRWCSCGTSKTTS